MPNLKNVVKVTQAQYESLKAGQTVEGHTYDPDNIYLVDSDENDVYETILWKNQSPNASFSGQTLYFEDLTKYDYIKVGYKFYGASDYNTMYKTFKSSDLTTSTQDGVLDAHKMSTGSGYMQYASRIIGINKTTVGFDAAYLQNGTSSPSSHNWFCVPVEIIGIKAARPVITEDRVLLWENNVSQTSWAGGTATVLNGQSLDNFKYLIIEWKEDGNDKGIVVTTVRNVYYGASSVPGTNCIIRLSYTYGGGGIIGQSHRYIQRINNSHTSFNVQNAYAGTTMNGSSTGSQTPGDCIPIRMWGTNTYQDSSSSPALKAYPIGSIYMSVNSTSPAELFGGTWERIEGMFLLGATGNTASTATDIQKTATVGPGGKGGEAAHQLSAPEMPSHNHDTTLYYKAATPTASGAPWTLAVDSNGSSGSNSYSSNSRGGTDSHNNMPPFLAVYMWKRTA